MKIAFVWPFEKAESIVENWRDGLRAALEILGTEHEVVWFLGQSLPTAEDNFQALLLWDDSNSIHLPRLRALGGRVGICLTTSPHNTENLRLADVVFCESQTVYDQVRRHGLRAVKAFGTDSDFFSPDPKATKDQPYFYPATFSPWKRQSAIAHLGRNLLCVGTIQPDGMLEHTACVEAGVEVKVGYFPVEEIRDLYRRTRDVSIPAIHGSERTVLEAMSMDIFPRVNPQNDKTYSLVAEYLGSGIRSPRQFVLSRYTARHYADALEKGLRG